MRLRPRIALVTAAVLAPMIALLVGWDALSRRAAAEDELVAFTRGLMRSAEWRAGCARAPERWRGDRARGRPPPGPRPAPTSRGERGPPPGTDPRPHREPASFFAYGADLTPHHPEAPALPAGLDLDATPLSLTPTWPDGTVRVLLRMPDGDETCAYVLARGTTEPWLGGVLPPTHLWLLPLLTVVAVVLLAIGPVVRRLRALTEAVQRSAGSAYESGVPIEGSDELTELARAFDAAAAEVRSQLAATRRREETLREYIANTRHDLMIPLTVLQGHLAELASRAPDAVVGHAIDEAHYIGALVADLAATARLDARPAVERHPVELAPLVERVIARHRPVARTRGVALDHATEPLTVGGDVTLIEQAVGNLVYNAIRYNRAGGHVAVVLEGRGEGFAISVIDDGPGDPAEIERLVARGARGDAARTRAPEGTGLGLHIAARVADAHGFALRFSPSAHGGVRVELVG